METQKIGKARVAGPARESFSGVLSRRGTAGAPGDDRGCHEGVIVGVEIRFLIFLVNVL